MGGKRREPPLQASLVFDSVAPMHGRSGLDLRAWIRDRDGRLNRARRAGTKDILHPTVTRPTVMDVSRCSPLAAMVTGR